MNKKRIFVIESHKGYLTVQKHIKPSDLIVTRLRLRDVIAQQVQISGLASIDYLKSDAFMVYTTDETYNSQTFELVRLLRKLKKTFRLVLLEHHTTEGRFHRDSKNFLGLSKSQIFKFISNSKHISIIKFNDGKIGLKWKVKFDRKFSIGLEKNGNFYKRISDSTVVLVPLSETHHGSIFRNYIIEKMNPNKIILKLHPREKTESDFFGFEKIDLQYIEQIYFENCNIINFNSSAKIAGLNNILYCVTEVAGVCILPDRITSSGLVFGTPIDIEELSDLLN